jgi:hypothetical protein
MVRLMLCHFGDQEFEVVGDALLQRIWRASHEQALQLATHPYIHAEYSMSPDRQPIEKEGALIFSTDTRISVHGLVAGSLWRQTTARPPYQLCR